MKRSFRVFGVIVLLFGLYFLFNAHMVLPGDMSWSHNDPGYLLTDYAVRLYAMLIASGVALLIGSLMLVLSFTTLVRSPGEDVT